jgi:hypothetical protein
MNRRDFIGGSIAAGVAAGLPNVKSHQTLFEPGDVMHINAAWWPSAITAIWRNTIGDNDLNNPANWDGDRLPFGDGILFTENGLTELRRPQLG